MQTDRQKKAVEPQNPLERLLAPFVQPLAQPAPAVTVEVTQPAMPVETKVGSRDYQPLLDGKLPGTIRNLVVRELSGQTVQPVEAAPAERPLLAELMQRIQAAEQPVATVKVAVEAPVTKPGLEPLMALLSEKKTSSEPGSDSDSEREPESDQPAAAPALPFAHKTEATPESAPEHKAPVKLIDQVEHGQHLARLQGKALVDKPRELEVQLHSEKLGAVAARVQVESGGQWTAHLQLRDAEVERSVRQELVQIQETRGLEGFTTSLSQDQRDQRGSFQGFSFEQQQRGPLGFPQKKSANPSSFGDPLPIERVSSANGNSNGLNVRA
ncbi:hypothetical protein ABS71_02460 [bacterium SCN 62-11]|nr:MAG: hypothetical protein ABS71_02460 [bacterium SCN 62-11]